MKCLLKVVDQVIHRVSDEQAHDLVRNFPKNWEYVPKRQWKNQRAILEKWEAEKAG